MSDYILDLMSQLKPLEEALTTPPEMSLFGGQNGQTTGPLDPSNTDIPSSAFNTDAPVGNKATDRRLERLLRRRQRLIDKGKTDTGRFDRINDRIEDIQGGGRGKTNFGKALRGYADFKLSLLGMDDIIQDSITDKSKFLNTVSEIGGKILPAAVSFVNPAVGAGLAAAGKIGNSISNANVANRKANQAKAYQGRNAFTFGGPNPEWMKAFDKLLNIGAGYGAWGGSYNSFLKNMDNNLVEAYGFNYKGNGSQNKNVQVMRDGGPIGLNMGQTEKYKGVKEQIVLPDMSIYPVNATKSHEKMKDDEVTDLLPEGGYVGSARTNMAINKKDIEEVSFGYGVTHYETEKGAKMPKEYKYADIFTKKRMTPAELLKSIKRKYPTTDRKHDPFADASNAENKKQRIPYIAATLALSEAQGKMNKPDQYGYGGKVKKKVPKYQDPNSGGGSGGFDPTSLLVSFGTDLILGGIDFFNNKASRKRQEALIEKNSDLNEADIRRMGQINALGKGVAPFFIDPNYTFLDDPQTGFADARREAIGGYDEAIQSIQNRAETQQGRIGAQLHNLSSSLFNNTSSFSRGAAAAASLLPNYLRASSDISARASEMMNNLQVRKGEVGAGYTAEMGRDRQKGLNYERDVRNMAQRESFSGILEELTNMNNQLIANRTNETSALLAAENKTAANLTNFLGNISNAKNSYLTASALNNTQPAANQGSQTTINFAPNPSLGDSFSSSQPLYNTTPSLVGYTPTLPAPSNPYIYDNNPIPGVNWLGG